MVTFRLENMRACDRIACNAAQNLGFVNSATGARLGQSHATFSGFAAHGTSVEAALSILTVGHIVPGAGICGVGVYAFEAGATKSFTNIWAVNSTPMTRDPGVELASLELFFFRRLQTRGKTLPRWTQCGAAEALVDTRQAHVFS